ncbi:hypothetical protein GF382_03360 [Candidatus Falkowbacteria bacterium]|nr:hypothetical protein [Candidatus Falkowbacteria bacterium]
MKKNILFAVVLVIMAAAAILAIANIEKERSWAIYENQRYGFRLEYPADWTLKDPEPNNAGREMISPDGGSSCYAYGFANALLNDQGRPQELDEFIDWLTDDSGIEIEVLERKESVLADQRAVYFLAKMPEETREAVYILSKDEGRGLFCTYKSESDRQESAGVFEHMRKSFEAKFGPANDMSSKNCQDLLNKTLVPLKGYESVMDEDYTEVTLISRKNWDMSRVPARVISLEAGGYACYPLPYEFLSSEEGGAVSAQPEVAKVEWVCELEYDSWEYLALDDVSGRRQAEESGHVCEKQACLDDAGHQGDVYLCIK